MKRVRASWTTSSAIAALALVLFGAALPRANDVPSCLVVRAESRVRYPGYDHVVHLQNECATDAHCEVATNIDPQPIEVTVAAGDHEAVVVRRGSPQRYFVPRVACMVVAAEPAAASSR